MSVFYLKQKPSIVSLLLISLVAGCGASPSDSTADVTTLNVAGAKCQNSTVLKVLFVGNSYTFVNNMPSLFKDLACDAGYNVEVTAATKGNYRFLNHASDASTLGAIDSRQWDFVILQNHSLIPSHRPADVTTTSLPHTLTLANAISLNNTATQIIYFVSQGREKGDIQNCPGYPLVCTFAGHTAALITGYGIYQTFTGGQLALAGSAWEMVVDDTNAPFDSGDLWASDNSHPELLGSYLTTCVLFATVFNQSPLGLVTPDDITEAHASYLQQTSADAMGL
jgi:hypothetical protein